jgi:hypothetical protein
MRSSVWVTYQLMQVGIVVDSLQPCEQLQKNDAEAVYIRFLIQPGCPGILWINVANGSYYISGRMGLGSWDSFGDAEI